MASRSTRQRLIQSALELFMAEGVSGTTTRLIAEAAGVNEVTLFRQFGNKQGLVLAVLEESAALKTLGESLVQSSASGNAGLRQYASEYLHALERVPKLIQSLVGEADQYPEEHRRALGQGLTEANRYVAQYLQKGMDRGEFQARLPAEKLAGLLNSMLLGYAVIEFTTQFHQLWESREAFLDHVVQLLQGTEAMPSSALSLRPDSPAKDSSVADLPAPVVHQILRQAKKASLQDYALADVLFGAGIAAVDMVDLLRSQQICDSNQHLLQVGNRQVPVNQWIMGKRYGSYTANPLTKWLKSRKDKQPHLFLNDVDQPVAIASIKTRWQVWTEDLTTPQGPPDLSQAPQTWCIDMLLRGMSLENLSILTGWELEDLQPYARRAQEIEALEQATRLD
ncbi:MAG: TetR/AcrR family transcriptional regulator, partial [Thermosynechococcaceae cyanobacterium]